MQVAILDDDVHQLDLLSHAVAGLGYTSSRFDSAGALLQALQRDTFDLMLVDWELPDMDGIEVLRTLRARHHQRTPVIFVTHRDDERDVVQALNAGADDYLVKPVRSAELKARVLALLRRAYPSQAPLLQHGDFTLQPATRQVQYRGQEVALKQREFDLALCFFTHLGQLLSRAYLMQTVWGLEADIPTRTLDTHVSAVRSKLGLRPDRGFRLGAVYGHGYRLEEMAPAPTQPEALP